MIEFERTLPKTIQFSGHFYKIQNFDNSFKIIRDELIKMTRNHCSYCNCLLRISEYTPEIEHFIPKVIRPSFDKAWFNLFVSCPKCNKNKQKNVWKYPPIKPLKPDSKHYRFKDFFRIDFVDGTLIPLNPRAKITIDWFGLNDIERCEARLREFEIFNEKQDIEKIYHYSYPFFIEAAIKTNPIKSIK